MPPTTAESATPIEGTPPVSPELAAKAKFDRKITNELEYAKGGKIDKDGVRQEADAQVSFAKDAVEKKSRELKSGKDVQDVIATLKKLGKDEEAAKVEAAMDALARQGSETAEGWLKDSFGTDNAFNKLISEKAFDISQQNPDKSSDQNYDAALQERHDQAMAAAIVFQELKDQVDGLKPVAEEDKQTAAHDLAEKIRHTRGEFNTPEGQQKLIDEGVEVTGEDGTKTIKKFTRDEIKTVLEHGLVVAEGNEPKLNTSGFQSVEEWNAAVFETASGMLQSQLVDKIANVATTDVDKKIYEKALEIWKKRTAAPDTTGTTTPPVTDTPGTGDGPAGDDGRDNEGEDIPEVDPPTTPEVDDIGRDNEGEDIPEVDPPVTPEVDDIGRDNEGEDIPEVDTPPVAPPTPETPALDPAAVERAAQARTEAVKAAEDKLKKYRDDYINARAITRNFWRNAWGTIVGVKNEDGDRISASTNRDASRIQYEMARDELIRLKAKYGAVDKGLEVPTPIADLDANASEEDKTAHEAAKADAEQKRKLYDQEILTQAITEIAAEKAALAKADLENMLVSSNRVMDAMWRLSKSPAIKFAVMGGLLASTATGFAPGMMAFGAAQGALSTIGLKGGLDLGAEQFAARLGREQKNKPIAEVRDMTQTERDQREAAVMESGFKRGKGEYFDGADEDNDASEIVRKINKATQEEVNAKVREYMDAGKVTGNTPEERAASVLKAALNEINRKNKEGNTNQAIDSRIDTNRNWNAVRWIGALAGVGAVTYFSSDIGRFVRGDGGTPDVPTGTNPDTSGGVAAPDGGDIGIRPRPEVSPLPQNTTEAFTPWVDASGNGYNWKGWAEGEVAKFMKMGEGDFHAWSAQHPGEANTARNALMDAMQKANPGVDFASAGKLGQAYNRPEDLAGIVNKAIRAAGNAR